MSIIDFLSEPSHEEIFENRLQLKSLNPDSRLLKYLCIANLGERGDSIIYFNQESSTRDEFERRFGLSNAISCCLRKYNEALKSAITLIGLQNRTCRRYPRK